MIEALIDGERRGTVLADLAKGRMRVKIPDLAMALEGRFDDHHALMCRLHLDHIDHLEEMIATLDAQTKSAIQAHEAIGDTLSLEAQLQGAQAAEGLAARNLDLTTLRAPCDGIVVGLQIAEGTFALSGQPLFSLIKSNAWYAIADFRETELPRIAVGDRATVWTMAESTRAFEGTVESLGAGVQSSDQDGPTLPKTGRDLDWVVVAQRFPVWVHLDHPPPEAMHVGMTASVKVHHAGAR